MRIIPDDDLLLNQTENYLVDENVVICEVFSAFAIESFLNTYAASCMGDSVFFDNYERLSALSKIQLISAILYQEQIEKGSELYNLLKHTFAVRDQHAHNKSKHMSGSTWEEVQTALEHSNDHPDEDLEKQLKSECETIKKKINDARLCINAIVGVACYIDSHDTNVNAKLRLLEYAPGWEIYGSSYDEDMTKVVSNLIKAWSKKC